MGRGTRPTAGTTLTACLCDGSVNVASIRKTGHVSVVEIPFDLQQFVQTAISSGAFHSESEVVAEGLRLLQRREQLRRDVNECIAQLERVERVDGEEVFRRLEAKAAQIARQAGAPDE